MRSKPRFAFVAAVAVVAVLALASAFSAVPVIAASSESTAAKARETNPGIDRVLARKAELGLTPQQDEQLRKLHRDLEEKNRPLLDQVEKAIGERPSPEQLRAMSEGERDSYQATRTADAKSHPELKPVYKQMRENRQVAWKEAKSILNGEQRGKVEQWEKEAAEKRKQKQKQNATGSQGKNGKAPSGTPSDGETPDGSGR